VEVSSLVGENKTGNTATLRLRRSCTNKCGDKLVVRFRILRKALEHAYETSLPAIHWTGKSRRLDAVRDRIKRWSEQLTTVRCEGGRRERHGLRMAIGLVKRGFPDPCDFCVTSGWESFRTQQACGVAPVEPEFLDFVRKQTRLMFPRGWLTRAKYESIVFRSSVSPGASSQTPRSKGGMRNDVTHESFLESVEYADPTQLGVFKYADVISAGKIRGVTLQPPQMAALRCLHTAMQDRVAAQPWSLTGPPTSRRFAQAGFKFREPILSGDYKSATNCLSLEVSRAILSTVLDGAVGVPDMTKELAIQSLRPTVGFRKEKFVVERGQMMGSFLSFPLLCLYNRLCSLYTLGEVPMLINGDDLVAETSDPSRWYEHLPSLGLEPESTKTAYVRGAANINSTAIIHQRGRAVVCKSLRMRALVPPSDVAIGTLGERFRTFIDCAPRRRSGANAWVTTHGRLVIGLLSKGVSLDQMGFGLRDMGLLPSICMAALKSARKYARPTDLHLPLPDVDRRSTTLVRERNMTKGYRAAIAIDNFCNGPPIIPGSYSVAKMVFARIRSRTPRRRACLESLARRWRLPVRKTSVKWYFNYYTTSDRYLRAVLNKTPTDGLRVPNWALSLERVSHNPPTFHPALRAGVGHH